MVSHFLFPEAIQIGSIRKEWVSEVNRQSLIIIHTSITNPSFLQSSIHKN